MRPVSPPFRFLRLATHPAALLALGLNILAPLSAAAQDTSRIARVTVYPGSATVARVAKVAAGARSLTLACLPASLDVQSLQINADPAAPCPCATAGTAWLHSVRRTKDTLATPWA